MSRQRVITPKSIKCHQCGKRIEHTDLHYRTRQVLVSGLRVDAYCIDCSRLEHVVNGFLALLGIADASVLLYTPAGEIISV